MRDSASKVDDTLVLTPSESLAGAETKVDVIQIGVDDLRRLLSIYRLEALPKQTTQKSQALDRLGEFLPFLQSIQTWLRGRFRRAVPEIDLRAQLLGDLSPQEVEQMSLHDLKLYIDLNLKEIAMELAGNNELASRTLAS